MGGFSTMPKLIRTNRGGLAAVAHGGAIAGKNRSTGGPPAFGGGLAAQGPFCLPKKYVDKRQCQSIMEDIRAQHPNWSITAVCAHSRVAPYARQYSGVNTLRNWAGEVDRRSADKKPGPKRKTH